MIQCINSTKKQIKISFERPSLPELGLYHFLLNSGYSQHWFTEHFSRQNLLRSFSLVLFLYTLDNRNKAKSYFRKSFLKISKNSKNLSSDSVQPKCSTLNSIFVIDLLLFFYLTLNIPLLPFVATISDINIST